MRLGKNGASLGSDKTQWIGYDTLIVPEFIRNSVMVFVKDGKDFNHAYTNTYLASSKFDFFRIISIGDTKQTCPLISFQILLNNFLHMKS